MKWGFRVPRTWCCLYQAYETWQADPAAIDKKLQKELDGIVKADVHYAVRSTAEVEDTE